ncbi:cobalt-precorrin-6A reductase [Marimonas arenosa]|uniref:Cobalt-precorrin-6A reductase n=1 Tax=Marimonas arenosa TaxID=1795305 RepID=A0AAE4B5D8_9RHOB|nr:cobalt-precorrin-6A reductase [Marimonas arenosa]MDQ2089151.1 cobalt-precorrin-6A reductase [Marimonas arenosa]
MKLLVLAGTGEARAIAARLAAERVDAVASLAGAVRAPRKLALPTRIGGFGGEDGFRTYLAEEGIGAVLDATHPFAVRISRRTATMCRDMGVPYCQFLRPEWAPEPGEDWARISTEEQAVEIIPEGAVVLLATGRQTAARFARLKRRRVICRVVEEQAEPFPFDGGEYLVQRPPFSLEHELALFRQLAIDWLVAKNAGGAAGRAKLDAARQLGVRVAMLDRPEQPEGRKAETVDAALAWVRGLE